MYVLDRAAVNPVTAALLLCVEHKYAEAIAQLDKAADGNSRWGQQPPPLVRRLRDRAEQALLLFTGGAFAVDVVGRAFGEAASSASRSLAERATQQGGGPPACLGDDGSQAETEVTGEAQHPLPVEDRQNDAHLIPQQE
jgi:hypothetical protein